MSEHKHSGPQSYMNNPGQVSEASGLQIEKDEHAPDPKVRRVPVVPQPAIPVEGGRKHYAYFGGQAPMSEAATAIKFPEPEKTNDDGSPQE
jgi:hypothetical protein